jgi:thiol-disulfide isomerase/thioredoxin
MKQLLFVIVVTVVFGCKNNIDNTDTKILVKIDGINISNLYLANDNPFDFAYDCALVDSSDMIINGINILECNISQSDFYKIKYGADDQQSFYIYIKPGDSIFVHYDPKQYRYDFIGKGSEYNNFLYNDLSLRFPNRFFEEWKSYNEEDLIVKATEYKEATLNHLNSFHNDYPDTSFYNYIKHKIILWHCYELLRVGNIIKYKFNKNINERSLLNFVEQEIEGLENVSIGELNYYSTVRMMLMYNVILSMSSELPSTKYYSEMYALAKESFTGNERDMAIVLTINKILGDAGYDGSLDSVETYIKDFEKLTEYKEYTIPLKKKLQKRRTLDSGAIAPDFEFYDKNMESKSIKDFKRKYLYINIWGTWCPHCTKQMEYFEKLCKMFNNSNVRFLSIALQSDSLQWLKYIEEKSLISEQYIYVGDFGSDFAKKYMIKGIPHFIIIDNKGKIISSNAMIPSNPKTEKILKKICNISPLP